MKKASLTLIAVAIALTACTASQAPPAQNASPLTDHVVSGGVPKDGIPSIDDPSFIPPEDADLRNGSIVFGVHRDGEAKAYPQRILVHHEIVNDRIGGDNVTVTYCPLTGTAVGFHRDNTTFGVSGRLVNNNLIMYDRATNSWYPQILGEGIKGPRTSERLDEFRVTWTTWSAWRTKHPDTVVLSEDTGSLRNYDNDPYGSYNPKNGYYDNDNVLFPVTHEDDRLSEKDIVIGYRDEHGAVAVSKDRLRQDKTVGFTKGNTSYTMLHDESLDTARLYSVSETSVEHTPSGYRYNGSTHAASNLPAEEEVVFDAFWFAWSAFYPDTELYD